MGKGEETAKGGRGKGEREGREEYECIPALFGDEYLVSRLVTTESGLVAGIIPCLLADQADTPRN